MNNHPVLRGIKRIQLSAVHRRPPYGLIVGMLGVLSIVAWSFIFNPLQEQLEARLQNYPHQLASLQELNRTLIIYKGRELPAVKMTEAEFSNLKGKLVSQGFQLNVMRLDRVTPVQISMQIDEIEFSRWLELIEQFRKNNSLYASDVLIKKNANDPGVVGVTAKLVQTP